MVLCDLSSVKKVIEKKPEPARVARQFAPTVNSGLSKLVTNKDEALAKFLQRKQRAGQELTEREKQVVTLAERLIEARPEVLMSKGAQNVVWEPADEPPAAAKKKGKKGGQSKQALAKALAREKRFSVNLAGAHKVVAKPGAIQKKRPAGASRAPLTVACTASLACGSHSGRRGGSGKGGLLGRALMDATGTGGASSR